MARLGRGFPARPHLPKSLALNTVAPVANFTGTPVNGAASIAVTFTDSTTNTPTSWAWTFGDGATSTAQNPVHTYAAAGVYTVALTATNSAGNDTKTRTSYLSFWALSPDAILLMAC